MKKKYGWIFIFIVAIAMSIIPFLIHFFSSGVPSEITADGLLDYLGNCVASIPTIIIAAVAIWQTNKANKIAEESNKISKKLLELEDLRQRLELRPSFAVINWRAPVKSFESITMHPELLSVQVGPYSDGIAWGIELELLNTSSGFETICYNEAIDECKNKIWLNCMVGMKNRKIELPSLETSTIYFFADREFWKSQNDKKIIVDFFVNNRLDCPYRESFELFIISMSDEVQHKENEVYLHLEIQNYNVGKYVGKSDEYPDGVNWEK